MYYSVVKDIFLLVSFFTQATLKGTLIMNLCIMTMTTTMTMAMTIMMVVVMMISILWYILVDPRGLTGLRLSVLNFFSFR